MYIYIYIRNIYIFDMHINIPVISEVMFFCCCMRPFLLCLNWGLSPPQNFRTFLQNLLEGRLSLGHLYWICARLHIFEPICARFADCLHYICMKVEEQKPKNARIDNLCSGLFFLHLVRSRSTWRKIDLHIEQAVGDKSTSHWRFLV